MSIWSRDPVCTNHSSPEDDEDVADHGDDDEEAQHQDGQHRLPVQIVLVSTLHCQRLQYYYLLLLSPL